MNDPSRVFVSGPFAAFREGFLRSLLKWGYTPDSAANQLHLMAHLSRWDRSRKLSTDLWLPVRFRTPKGRLRTHFKHWFESRYSVVLCRQGVMFRLDWKSSCWKKQIRDRFALPFGRAPCGIAWKREDQSRWEH